MFKAKYPDHRYMNKSNLVFQPLEQFPINTHGTMRVLLLSGFHLMLAMFQEVRLPEAKIQDV